MVRWWWCLYNSIKNWIFFIVIQLKSNYLILNLFNDWLRFHWFEFSWWNLVFPPLGVIFATIFSIYIHMLHNRSINPTTSAKIWFFFKKKLWNFRILIYLKNYENQNFYLYHRWSMAITWHVDFSSYYLISNGNPIGLVKYRFLFKLFYIQ